MKTASMPSLRVDPELRRAAKAMLREGESLSSFMEQSLRDEVRRRQARREFFARGLDVCTLCASLMEADRSERL